MIGGRFLEVVYIVEPPVCCILASVVMKDNYSLHCFIGKVIGSDFSIVKSFVKTYECLWYIRNI